MASRTGPRSSLIGREVELDALGEAILSPGSRLHTIVGTGGLGKTILARALLAEHCGKFPGGAFFVDLSAVRDALFVPQALAAVLGASEASRSGLSHGLEDAIAARIGGARTLVVLDNFEQVLAARSFVVRLLSACPALTALATSRERLGIEGESVFELRSLGFPTGQARARADDRGSFAALELLAQRGAEANATFELSDENAPACAALCAALDGLPLALELAASRFSILAPSELLTRLDRRLELIAASKGSFPERHRTLRAVVDWSYELLEGPEQELFSCLATFEGSFDLEAAEAVWAPSLAMAGSGLVDGLASLVDKSLLRRSCEHERTRFSFLESIRAFARERLALRGDRVEIERLHANHFMARAERCAPELQGKDQRATMVFLDPDQANFRSALDWFMDAGEAEKAFRICLALEWHWYRSGTFSWGERALRTALELHGGEGAKALRGSCLRALGWIRFVQGAWREAHSYYLEAASILRGCGDRSGLARCLADMGVVERWLGNRVAGDARCLEAIGLAREIGEGLLLAYALIWGYGTTGGKRVDGGQLEGLEEAIALARRMGDPWAEAHALGSLGDYLRESGRAAEAVACYEAAFRGFKALEDEWMLAWSLEGMGMNASILGDPRAPERLLDSLRIFVRLGDKCDATYVFGKLALAFEATGDRAQADLLFGAYSVQGREFGHDDIEAALVRDSPEWRRGRLMSYDEIVAFAFSCNDPATRHANTCDSGGFDGNGN